jgi:hypothetical protein
MSGQTKYGPLFQGRNNHNLEEGTLSADLPSVGTLEFCIAPIIFHFPLGFFCSFFGSFFGF